MLEFEQARAAILGRARLLGTETVPIQAAIGRVLQEDVLAPRPQPDADTSAMDGYAVNVGSLLGNGPWQLEVGDESRAGEPFEVLTPGTACRIFTGALLPSGADAVILQEDVTRTGQVIAFPERPRAGQNVRPQGSEIEAGAVALPRGQRLDAFALGLLASLDRTRVRVARSPRVSILCSGSELRDPGSRHWRGSIPESNGVALAALVAAAGGTLQTVRRVPDELDATREALSALFEDSDVVLTVGGVSVGDHDVMRRALATAGAEVEFWKVRIKPGKPLVFARRGECLVLGLPGNPVSAQLTCLLFAVPLLRALQGDRRALPSLGSGVLGAPLQQKPGRMVFHRVRVEGDRVWPLADQSSGSTASLAHADALAIVAAESSGLDAGERVSLLRLSDP